jgi:hypothetical protein
MRTDRQRYMTKLIVAFLSSCVLCGSQKKQRLFPYAALSHCVYCAVRTEYIHKFYVLPTQCVYVFCVDLRTNSDYFTVQNYLTGFYNRYGVCLLRCTY